MCCYGLGFSREDAEEVFEISEQIMLALEYEDFSPVVVPTKEASIELRKSFVAVVEDYDDQAPREL